MNRWVLWQIADSAFPTGGFTHSSGLEAAWQSGEVADDEALRTFVHDAIAQAGQGALPLLNAAHQTPSRLAVLDALADAFLTNAVANRASRVQGRALLSTCVRVWPSTALKAIDARVRVASVRDPQLDQTAACPGEATVTTVLHGHYAPLAGAIGRALDLPLDVTQRLCLYQTARGVLAAAVRLGIVGSYEAQRLQAGCAPVLDAVLARCSALGECHLAQTAPIIDILQSAHDRLYSRLFQS